MERDQATRMMQGLLKKMVGKNGSDLFITAGFPPAIKVDGEIHRAGEQALTPDQSAVIVRSIMNDKQAREFDATKECNFAISPQGIGRFRVSASFSRARWARCCEPSSRKFRPWSSWSCPSILEDVVMTKRGLVIMVGATGSGKIDDTGGHGGLSQRKFAWPHSDHRGPGGIRAPAPQVHVSLSVKSGVDTDTGTTR